MKGINLDDLDQKLKLVHIFKEKKPVDFFSAYAIAFEAGIGKNKIIVEALEIYAARRGFKVK